MTAPSMATVADLNRGSFRQVVAFFTSEPDYLPDRLAAASAWVERECDRRFMPFTGLVETTIASGVRPALAAGSAQIVPTVGGLGIAQSSGGVLSGMVRDFWVSEYARHQPELWTYTGITVDLRAPWATATTRVPAAQVSGPTEDTGHVQLGPAVYCPPGTEVTITYGGGYTLGYPVDLLEAVRTETVRQLLVELDPDLAPGLSTDVLERDTDRKLCHWRRRARLHSQGAHR